MVGIWSACARVWGGPTYRTDEGHCSNLEYGGPLARRQKWGTLTSPPLGPLAGAAEAPGVGRSASPARPGGLGPCSGPGQKAAVSGSPLSAGGLLLRSPLPPPAARPPLGRREPYIHLAPTRPPPAQGPPHLSCCLTCPPACFPPIPPLPPPAPCHPPNSPSQPLATPSVTSWFFTRPPQAPLPPPNKDINFNPLVQPVSAGRRWIPPSFFALFFQALTLHSELFPPSSFPSFFPCLSLSPFTCRGPFPPPSSLSLSLSSPYLSQSTLTRAPPSTPIQPSAATPPRPLHSTALSAHWPECPPIPSGSRLA